MKKSEKVATAFLRLLKSRDGEVIIDYYRARLSDMDKNSRRLLGDKLIIENGKRLCLEEMIGDLEAAEDILHKTENPKPHGIMV